MDTVVPNLFAYIEAVRLGLPAIAVVVLVVIGCNAKWNAMRSSK